MSDQKGGRIEIAAIRIAAFAAVASAFSAGISAYQAYYYRDVLSAPFQSNLQSRQIDICGDFVSQTEQVRFSLLTLKLHLALESEPTESSDEVSEDESNILFMIGELGHSFVSTFNTFQSNPRSTALQTLDHIVSAKATAEKMKIYSSSQTIGTLDLISSSLERESVTVHHLIENYDIKHREKYIDIWTKNLFMSFYDKKTHYKSIRETCRRMMLGETVGMF